MSLARNEIRHRAIKFANEWKDAAREAAEKQTYWNEFFDVFGISRKAFASFEAPVKKITGHDGCIDLFWKGNLIVEHKSPGGDLGKRNLRLSSISRPFSARASITRFPAMSSSRTLRGSYSTT